MILPHYQDIKDDIYARGKSVETIELPEGNDMRDEGEFEKCIYEFILSGG